MIERHSEDGMWVINKYNQWLTYSTTVDGATVSMFDIENFLKNKFREKGGHQTKNLSDPDIQAYRTYGILTTEFLSYLHSLADISQADQHRLFHMGTSKVFTEFAVEAAAIAKQKTTAPQPRRITTNANWYRNLDHK